MKIPIFKKTKTIPIFKKNKFVLKIGIFFQNWGKSHLNFIGNGAEFQPEITEKIPEYV